MQMQNSPQTVFWWSSHWERLPNSQGLGLNEFLKAYKMFFGYIGFKTKGLFLHVGMPLLAPFIYFL